MATARISVQYIYHPENDAFVAEKIINSSGLKQHLDISNFSINKLGTPDRGYWKEMESVDVFILLIGSTFDKIAPFIYAHDNFIIQRKGVFGIDISQIPNEWGERKKAGKIWLDYNQQSIGKKMRDIIKIHGIPSGADEIEYIRNNISEWVSGAYAFAKAGYV